MPGERGEYRSMDAHTVDELWYQELTAAGRHVYLTLRLTLGPLGIASQPGLVPSLVERTGLPADVVEAALDELVAADMVACERNVVWVIDGLALETHMSATSRNHQLFIQRRWAELPAVGLRDRFRERYAPWFENVEAPSKALRRASRGHPDHITDAVADPDPRRNAVGSNDPTGAAPRAAVTPESSEGQRAAAGRLMALVRRHLYVNGRPPADYDEGRDYDIIRRYLRGRQEGEIAAAIEGLGQLREKGEITWLKPGESATMRAIRNTRSGLSYVFDLAQREFFKSEARKPMAESVGQILRRAQDGQHG